jgi:hypothetical protein
MENIVKSQPLRIKLLLMLILATTLIFSVVVRTSAQDILWVNAQVPSIQKYNIATNTVSVWTSANLGTGTRSMAYNLANDKIYE